MNAGGSCDAVMLRDGDRAAAVAEVLADRDHRAYAGRPRALHDRVAIGIEDAVVDVAMRVDHVGASNSIFGKSGALRRVCILPGKEPQDCSDDAQSSSMVPGTPNCSHIWPIRSGMKG